MAHPAALRLRSARRSLHAHVRQRTRRPVLHPLESRRHDGPNDHRRRLRPSHRRAQGRPCQSHHERRRRPIMLEVAIMLSAALPDQTRTTSPTATTTFFRCFVPSSIPSRSAIPALEAVSCSSLPRAASPSGLSGMASFSSTAWTSTPPASSCAKPISCCTVSQGAYRENALTAPAKVIESLPQPFVAAYQLAREADQAGQPEIVEEIAATLRIQQALFDPDEFVVQLETPKGPATAEQRPPKANGGPPHPGRPRPSRPNFSRIDMNCKHPPTRIYSWFAYDGTFCAGCCDCGEVLAGAADDSESGGGSSGEAGARISRHRIKPHAECPIRPKRHDHKPRRKKE